MQDYNFNCKTHISFLLIISIYVIDNYIYVIDNLHICYWLSLGPESTSFLQIIYCEFLNSVCVVCFMRSHIN